jgi:hypothetical protein
MAVLALRNSKGKYKNSIATISETMVAVANSFFAGQCRLSSSALTSAILVGMLD